MKTTIRSVVLKVGFTDFRTVQPLKSLKAVGQTGCESSLYLPSGQFVQAVGAVLRKSQVKCPSVSQYLKELKMDERVDFIWLPIDRVAMLMKVSVKTTHNVSVTFDLYV